MKKRKNYEKLEKGLKGELEKMMAKLVSMVVALSNVQTSKGVVPIDFKNNIRDLCLEKHKYDRFLKLSGLKMIHNTHATPRKQFFLQQ